MGSGVSCGGVDSSDLQAVMVRRSQMSNKTGDNLDMGRKDLNGMKSLKWV
jgi:hypothetical protein